MRNHPVSVGCSRFPEHPQGGVILPFLLFLLLALTLLAHGTLLLARREMEASEAFLRAVVGKETARSALNAALGRIPLSEEGEIVLGEPREILRESMADGSWRRASVRWLNPELFLLEGTGGVRGGEGLRKVGAVGWRLDPLTRLGALKGWLELGGELRVAGGGGISAAEPFATPHGWDASDCAPELGTLRSILRATPIPPVSRLNASPIPSPDPPIPGLGFLEGEALLALKAEPGPGDLMGPAFGATPESGCPGTGEPVLLGAEGSLMLRDVRLCGLLVVGGDLALEGEGAFQGVALVGGDLHLEGSWTLQGMARVRGSVDLGGTSRIEASACAVFRTLAGMDELRESLLLPGASLLGPF